MNKIFKVIYSKTKHMYVVASELAKSHSKSKNEGATSGKALAALVMAALASVSFMVAPLDAQAADKTDTTGWKFIGIWHNSTDESNTSENYQSHDIAVNDKGAIGEHSITIGVHTQAGPRTIVIGDRLASTSQDSVFIGSGYDANGVRQQAKGGIDVVVIGSSADATGTGSIALGYGATADPWKNVSDTDKKNANKNGQSIAFGYNAQAENNNIAIGANSVATAAASTENAKFRDTTASDYKAPTSYVSVGSSTNMRRITNVAAGSDANDAATVGQLEKVAAQKGSWQLTAGKTNATTVDGDNNTVDFSAAVDGKDGTKDHSNVVISKDTDSSNVKIGLSNNVILGEDAENKGGSLTVNRNVSASDDQVGNQVTMNGSTIDVKYENTAKDGTTSEARGVTLGVMRNKDTKNADHPYGYISFNSNGSRFDLHGATDTDDSKLQDRMVYEAYKDGKQEYIANLDDGLKVTGDTADTTISTKLDPTSKSNALSITGGADSTNLTKGNIGVVATAANDAAGGNLNIQLAKDLTGITSITSQTASNTAGGKIAFSATGTTISGGDVSVDSNKITNVKSGLTAADGTYADSDKSNAANIGDVHSMITKEAGTTDSKLALKANVDASNIGKNLKDASGNAASAEEQTANEEKWGEAIGTGFVASGDKKLVTGGTVYTETHPTANGNYIKSADSAATNLTTLDTQVHTNETNIATNTGDIKNLKDLSNITDAGKTVIKNLAKGSVKVVDGTNTTVSKGTDGDAQTYAVNVSDAAIKGAVKDDLDKKANVDATNITGDNVAKWQSALGTGAVASGNTGLVTGGAVYSETHAAADGTYHYINAADSAGKNLGALDSQVYTNETNIATNTGDIKSLKDLSNITEKGQTVIKDLAKGSVKVIDGTNTTVSKGTDGDAQTYAVNVSDEAIKGVVKGDLDKKANVDASNITGDNVAKWQSALGTGAVASGNTGLVTGGAVYSETHAAADGTYHYINAADSAGKNLGALDSQVYTNETNIATNTGDIKSLKDLSNITEKGQTVIKDLAKGSVKVIDGTNTTVTKGTDGDAKTYAVNVSDTAIKGAVQGDLDKKANVDATNITGDNVAKWQSALGTGSVASGNTGLVTGGTVYDALHGGLDNITVGKDGKDGTPGKDGSIGIIGQTGAKGDDGKNAFATTIIKTEQGAAGVDGKDGKDGITRVIYQDKDGKNKHTIATLDDGLKFKGDDSTVITKKLDEQLDITGGADSTKLTDKNIGVNNVGGKLKVQLAKDLTGITSITSQTTDSAAGGKISFSDKGTTISGGDVSVSNNKITNLAPGTADADAATVKQVNAVDAKADANSAAIKTNSDNIEKNGKSIEQNSAAIKTNSDNIEKNGKAIEKNSAAIKTNADNIEKNGKAIEQNSAAIKTNSDNIEKNGKAIEQNSAAIKTNSDNIEKISKTVEQNSAAIKTNADNIEKNSKAIEKNSTAIKTNSDNIEKNGKAIEKNSAAIKTNSDNIEKISKTVEQTTSQVATNSNNIEKNGKAIEQNSAAIKTNSDNIEKNSAAIESLGQNKANIDASNIGKNMKDADGKAASTDAAKANEDAWGDAIGTGKVESGNKQLVTGDTVYNELRPTDDGSYIKKDNTTAQNLVSLDTQVKKTADLINSDGSTIKIGGSDKATKIDISGKDSGGSTTARIITGVQTDAQDATSAANVGYVNDVAAANTQQIYRDMHSAYGHLNNNINKAAAGSNALAALHPLDYDPADKASYAVGYGHYRNANAAAVGAFYQPNANTMVSVGVSMGNGDPGVNAGVSFKVGKGSAYNGVSKAQMAETIAAQEKQISEIKASDVAKDQRIDSLEKENQEMKKQIQEILAKLGK